MTNLERTEVSSMPVDSDIQLNRSRDSSIVNLQVAKDVNRIKRSPTRSSLSKPLSVIYAIVLTIVGFLFPLTEALTNKWRETIYNMVFQILIFTLAIAFLVYLQFRLIPLSKSKRRELKKQERKLQKTESIIENRGRNPGYINPVMGSFQSGDSGDNDNSSGTDSDSESVQENLQDDEILVDISKLGNAFSHHGSNLYLRLGALLFALGNVVYIGLEIENSVNARQTVGCNELTYWWTFTFRLAFLLAQSFLIFKNIKVEICFHQPLARFGFMHLVATNMCVWLQTLINEVIEVYHMNHSTKPNYHNDTDPEDDDLKHHTTAAPNLVKECQYYAGILKDASPYLYPFVLEYSLIAIGMIAFIFSSIDDSGNSKMLRGLQHVFQVQCFEWDEDPNEPRASVSSQSHAPVNHMKLEKSHKGMFLGTLLLAGSAFSIFLFYYKSSEQNLIYFITNLGMHSILLVATIIGIYQLRTLSFIGKPISVDDIFVAVSMSGSVIYELALIIPSSSYIANAEDIEEDHEYSTEVIKLCSSLVALVQTLAQTGLLITGMRKYSSKQSHLNKMPGRGTIIFLLIGNVGVWINRTMQSKQINYHTEETFYGLLASLLLLDTNLPLLVFFRFHSSVCLAEIWGSAYSPMHKELPQKFIYRKNQDPNAAEPRSRDMVEFVNGVFNSRHGQTYGRDGDSVFMDPTTRRASMISFITDSRRLSLPITASRVGQGSRPPTQPPQSQPLSSLPLQGTFARRGRSGFLSVFPPDSLPEIRVTDETEGPTVPVSHSSAPPTPAPQNYEATREGRHPTDESNQMRSVTCSPTLPPSDLANRPSSQTPVGARNVFFPPTKVADGPAFPISVEVERSTSFSTPAEVVEGTSQPVPSHNEKNTRSSRQEDTRNDNQGAPTQRLDRNMYDSMDSGFLQL